MYSNFQQTFLQSFQRHLQTNRDMIYSFASFLETALGRSNSFNHRDPSYWFHSILIKLAGSDLFCIPTPTHNPIKSSFSIPLSFATPSSHSWRMVIFWNRSFFYTRAVVSTRSGEFRIFGVGSWDLSGSLSGSQQVKVDGNLSRHVPMAISIFGPGLWVLRATLIKVAPDLHHSCACFILSCKAANRKEANSWTLSGTSDTMIWRACEVFLMILIIDFLKDGDPIGEDH